ncbi:hypothetical protein AB1P65_09495 [Roseibium alexandrii]
METDEKRGPGRPKTEKMFSVKLTKGYWPERRNSQSIDGGKVLAGEIIDLPAEEAKKVVEDLRAGELTSRDW